MSLLRNALTLTAVTLLSLAGATAGITSAHAAPAASTTSAASTASGAVPQGITGGAGTAADPTPAKPKKLFTIDDERVDESSGLAKSAKYEGIWWTVNDSGDTARVFGVDATGKVRAVIKFSAKVRDVEAIAVDRQGTIYVADIGDNKSTREMIAVYTIPEPDELGDHEGVKYHRYDFEYPDGAHDAETLMVEPETSRLYFVTKVEQEPGAIYAAPKKSSRVGTNKLTKVADAPATPQGITDGTFMPDGRAIVLRSYFGVASMAWGETPTFVARADTSIAQGESVAVGPGGDDLLVGSEGSGSAVYQMPVPWKAAAKPTTKPSTAPKPAAADSSAPKQNHSLRWIIVGAALLAIIITFVTFPPGRRERLDRMAENARLTGQPPPNPHGRRRSRV